MRDLSHIRQQQPQQQQHQQQQRFSATPGSATNKIPLAVSLSRLTAPPLAPPHGTSPPPDPPAANQTADVYSNIGSQQPTSVVSTQAESATTTSPAAGAASRPGGGGDSLPAHLRLAHGSANPPPALQQPGPPHPQMHSHHLLHHSAVAPIGASGGGAGGSTGHHHAPPQLQPPTSYHQYPPPGGTTVGATAAAVAAAAVMSAAASVSPGGGKPQIGIKRCDLWTYGGRDEPYTPVANCCIEPIVILGYGAERFDDDDVECRNQHNIKVFYRWKRGPARAVCFFHPHQVAKIQCTVTLRCFCSYGCFSRGQVQLRRFYLSGGKVAVPRQSNEYSYGVPCQKPTFDDNRDADALHQDLLISAGLVVSPEEEVWSIVSYSRHYTPTSNDVGHQLRFEVAVTSGGPPSGAAPQGSGQMQQQGSMPGSSSQNTLSASPVLRIASPLVSGNAAGRSAAGPFGPPRTKTLPPAPPPSGANEVLTFWSELDVNGGTAGEDQLKRMDTGCVVPQAGLLARRPMVPVGLLSLLGGSRPENQRIMMPGTPLAEALGIGTGSYLHRLPKSRRNNFSNGEKGLEKERLKAIADKRIALLTEQSFLGWDKSKEQTEKLLDTGRPLRTLIPGPLPRPNKVPQPTPAVSLATAGDVGIGEGFTVMTWNVLADIYATNEAYPYSPPFVLAWNYRRDRILAELLAYSPDIICLQEVQGDHFEDFFAPALLRRGYEGLYKQKTSRVFRGSGKHRGGRYVCDGCATFFRVPKFHLSDHFGIEFARVAPPLAASRNASKADKRLNKDNVALVLCLEQLVPSRSKSGGGGGADGAGATDTYVKKRVVVANTHILANPEAPDVKIWQANTLTTVLTEYLDKSMTFGLPGDVNSIPGLVVCGDFNSMPNSAVYQLVSRGSCDAHHEELHNSDVCKWLSDIPLGHGLNLRSSYGLAAFSRHEAARGVTLSQYDDSTNLSIFEPEFTNYTHSYVGCLDYIFFDDRGLKVTATLDLVREIQLLEESHQLQLSDWALPSPQRPSDHLPLLSRFEWTK